MSDETPTQRLPEQGGAGGSANVSDELTEERRKSRILMTVLIAIGGVLLIGLIVLLVLLFGPKGGAEPQPTPSGSPSASPTPSDSPSPSPTPTPTPTPEQTESAPPPPPPPAVIVSYSASSTNAHCPDPNAAVPITFNWNTTGSEVAFGIGTDNAEQQPYQTGLPAVGGLTIDYQCSEDGPDQKYSIAVLYNGSVIGRQTIVIKDN